MPPTPFLSLIAFRSSPRGLTNSTTRSFTRKGKGRLPLIPSTCTKHELRPCKYGRRGASTPGPFSSSGQYNPARFQTASTCRTGATDGNDTRLWAPHKLVRNLSTETNLQVDGETFTEAPPANEEDVAGGSTGISPSHEQLGIKLDRPSSPLDSLRPGYTPGLALRVLQTKGAGGVLIRRTELRDLCLASRPAEPKDAKVILTALRDFKRCNGHVLVDWQAKAALDGMIRSMTMAPEENPADDREAKLVAGMYACRALLDPATGLYTSVNTVDVDEIFSLLLDAVQGCHEDNYPVELRSTILEEGASYSPLKAMELTKRVFHMLLIRSSNPERKMKKRAARRYKRLVMRSDGPSAVTTHIASQICLAVGAAGDAQVPILDPFLQRRWVAKEETIRMVNEAKEKEELEAAEAAAEAEAARAEAEAAAMAEAEAEAEAAAMAESEATAAAESTAATEEGAGNGTGEENVTKGNLEAEDEVVVDDEEVGNGVETEVAEEGEQGISNEKS